MNDCLIPKRQGEPGRKNTGTMKDREVKQQLHRTGTGGRAHVTLTRKRVLAAVLITKIVDKHDDLHKKGEQGWRSGESARLPPMWPGFDSGPVSYVG